MTILGPNFRRMRLVNRQASLKEQYHFDCKCSICMDPHKDDMFFNIVEGLVCLSCNSEIPVTLSDLDVSDTVYCDLCFKQFRTLDFKKRLLKADKTYNKGKCYNSKLISITYNIIQFIYLCNIKKLKN